MSDYLAEPGEKLAVDIITQMKIPSAASGCSDNYDKPTWAVKHRKRLELSGYGRLETFEPGAGKCI